MGIAWSIALESKIHEFRGSILGRCSFDGDVIVRILIKTKFLPILANEVELTLDEEFEIRSSN